MSALDADPGGLSARVSELGKRRPPKPVNPSLAQNLPHKCYMDYLIPIVPAGGGDAANSSEAGGDWHFVKKEIDSAGREINKRGWIVTRPGAKATVHLNTAFHGEGIDETALVGITFGCGVRPTLIVQRNFIACACALSATPHVRSLTLRMCLIAPLRLRYLKSYEHMGIVSVACADGCSCTSMEIDAHDARKHESVLATAQLNATQSTDCTLALELLEKTSSSEHKFKVGHNTCSPRRGEGAAVHLWGMPTADVPVPPFVFWRLASSRS